MDKTWAPDWWVKDTKNESAVHISELMYFLFPVRVRKFFTWWQITKIMQLQWRLIDQCFSAVFNSTVLVSIIIIQTSLIAKFPWQPTMSQKETHCTAAATVGIIFLFRKICPVIIQCSIRTKPFVCCRSQQDNLTTWDALVTEKNITGVWVFIVDQNKLLYR